MNINKKSIIFLVLCLAGLGLVGLFSKVFAVGILFCVFLGAVTYLALIKSQHRQILLRLFIFVFIVHILFSVFVYVFHFQPFGDGGGDFVEYDFNGQQIAGRLNNGNFSLANVQGLFGPISTWSHYFSVVVGYIYAFTVPDMLMGQLFNAWIASLISVAVFFLAIEAGASEKGSWLAGLVACFYPSLFFYSSLLLKDPLVILLSLVALMFIIKLVKNFDWKYFLYFYFITGLAIHFRFYAGYSIILAFIFSFLFFNNIKISKKIVLLAVLVVLFGFLPQLFTNQGYWASKSINDYLNPKTITYYREEVYSNPEAKRPGILRSLFGWVHTGDVDSDIINSTGSNIEVDTDFENPLMFVVNVGVSYIYTVLGPLPWQLKYKRHLFVLIETIPWYFLLFFAVRGIIKNIKQKYRTILPMLFFAIILSGALSLFISNFGITTRIRISAFLIIFALAPLGLKSSSFVYRGIDAFTKRIYNMFQCAR